MPRKTTNFKLATLNAQSLNTGREELVRLMHSSKPDILTVTETRLNQSSNLKHYHLEGYRLLHKPRGKGKKREGGGIGMYIQNRLRSREIVLPPGDLEQHWIEIKINNRKLAVGVVYKPPKFSVNEFINHLSNTISTIFPQYDYIFLTGDININLLDKSSNESNSFMDLLHSNNLQLIVEQPTRVTSTTRTLLDVICCNIDLQPQIVSVTHNDDLSDHAFVSAVFPIKLPIVAPRLVTYRPFHEFDLNTYSFASSITPWDWVTDFNTVDEMVNCFNFLLLGLFDHFVP